MTQQRELAGATAAVTPTIGASAVTMPKILGKDGTVLKITKIKSYTSQLTKSFSPCVSPAQKKKRRKSRWSAGVFAKKKSSSSPHTSRDDAHLGSDEEEEDGDDEEEEEVGKGGGGAECDGRTEGEEDQMTVDVESGTTPAQEGSLGPTAKEQDSQEGREERSQAAEDKVILCETGNPENDEQTQNEQKKVDKAVKDQPRKSEENQVLTKAGNKNSETISVNTNKDSHTRTEGFTQGQFNTEKSGETKSEMLTETETDKWQTVTQADNRNNKVETVEEAEQNSHAEPMEVEATDTSATDASAAARGEDDTGTGLILAKPGSLSGEKISRETRILNP